MTEKRQARRATGRRAPINRERVLEAALALADDSGVESLTMRRLAKELHLESPMSLYNHVGNREDLLDGLVDIVFSQIELPEIGGDWKTEMAKRATSTRDALRRHRWANGLMESRMHPGPANLHFHNAVLGCLRTAGFSVRMAIHAYSVLDAYVYGFALQEKSLPLDATKERAQVTAMKVDAMQHLLAPYPFLAETVGGPVVQSGYDFAEEFDFGLTVILDALERLRVATGSSEAVSRL